MPSMDCYPKAGMERSMKVQDVMLQAMAKKITWWQAAEILGISDRHMRRIRERYVEEGYNGLVDRRRGKPSRRRVPLATVEKVFALYREKYFDLNVQAIASALIAAARGCSRPGCCARPHAKGIPPTIATASWDSASLESSRKLTRSTCCEMRIRSCTRQ